MSTKAQRNSFLLAVRELEKTHGLYIYTSEWLNISSLPPEPRYGVLSAADDSVETLRLAALSGQEIKTEEEYEDEWDNDQD
jgi:hypothetical protein